MQKREMNVTAGLGGSALQAVSGVTVTVTNDATGLPAALYSDNGVTLITAPIVTDTLGFYSYYAADGKYTETLTGLRLTAPVLRQIILEDPADNPVATLGQLAAGGGGALVKTIAAGAGAVAQTVQEVLRETVSVKRFGAKGDGVTNDLPAIQLAVAAMTSGMELLFPSGVYLLQWTGAKQERNTIALDLLRLSNIKITGQGATIKIVNHDVGVYGGLLFLRHRACKNVHVSGFKADMSFIGVNTSALFYPESGFMYGYNITENATAWPVPVADRMDNITCENLHFDIRSVFGAYSITPNPYQGDSNNGGKYYSLFLRGEQNEQLYKDQSKGVVMRNITFAETHEGYGVWVWGISDNYIEVNAPSWATRTMNSAGAMLGGSVAAVRCHKFFTRNWKLNVQISGRASELRVGTQNGGGALISFEQEGTTYDPESMVSISGQLTVGSNSVADAVPVQDIGVQILCGGNYDLSNLTIACNAARVGGTAIRLNDSVSCGGRTQYFTGDNITFTPSCQKLYGVVYASASNVSAADRSIKAIVLTNCKVFGYYKSFYSREAQAKTFEGPAFQVVSDNRIYGTANTLIPNTDATNIPIDIHVSQGGDGATANNNTIVSCFNGIKLSGAAAANCTPFNNNVLGAVGANVAGGAGINYTPKSTSQVTSFVSATPVDLQGSARKMFAYTGIALDATGLVKDKMAGNFPGGTRLVNAPTGFTWVLFQSEIADI